MRGIKFLMMGAEDPYLDTTPLRTGAMVDVPCKADGGFYAIHKDVSPGAVPFNIFLEGLAGEDRTLHMDCALFAQCVLQAQILQQADAAQQVQFAVGICAARVIVERLYTRFPTGCMPTGSFSPIDPEVVARTATWFGDAKSQWLSGPDHRGYYVGLSQVGPRRLKLEQWHRMLMKTARATVESHGSIIPQRTRKLMLSWLDDADVLGFDRYVVHDVSPNNKHFISDDEDARLRYMVAEDMVFDHLDK